MISWPEACHVVKVCVAFLDELLACFTTGLFVLGWRGGLGRESLLENKEKTEKKEEGKREGDREEEGVGDGEREMERQ